MGPDKNFWEHQSFQNMITFRICKGSPEQVLQVCGEEMWKICRSNAVAMHIEGTHLPYAENAWSHASHKHIKKQVTKIFNQYKCKMLSILEISTIFNFSAND